VKGASGVASRPAIVLSRVAGLRDSQGRGLGAAWRAPLRRSLAAAVAPSDVAGMALVITDAGEAEQQQPHLSRRGQAQRHMTDRCLTKLTCLGIDMLH
jgi:hypothetical protein